MIISVSSFDRTVQSDDARNSYRSKFLCSGRLRKFRIERQRSEVSCRVKEMIANGKSCRGNPLFCVKSKSKTVFFEKKKFIFSVEQRLFFGRNYFYQKFIGFHRKSRSVNNFSSWNSAERQQLKSKIHSTINGNRFGIGRALLCTE